MVLDERGGELVFWYEARIRSLLVGRNPTDELRRWRSGYVSRLSVITEEMEEGTIEDPGQRLFGYFYFSSL